MTTTRTMTSAIAIAIACTIACGGGSPSSADDAGARDAATTPAAAQVTARVAYAGAKQGQLAIGVFTENPPKTQPPVTYDTNKAPRFPYAATLGGIDPGHYWVVAVLDLPPFSPGNPQPGPEDLVSTSDAIDLAAGDAKTVDLTLVDHDGG